MRVFRKFSRIVFLCVFVPSLAYFGISSATGWDPLDLNKDEVPQTASMPGYDIVHDPVLEKLADEIKAVEPDHGWDTEWRVDGVVVRFRQVGADDLEVEYEGEDGNEVSDAIGNVLVKHGFRER
jgi:hypothetical protein